MKANVAYEVFKALSDEEKGHFMTLAKNDEFNLRTIVKNTKNIKEKVLTEHEAINYLLKNIFTKAKN